MANKNAPAKNNTETIYNAPQPVTFGDYVDGVRIAAPYMKSLALTLSNAQPDDLEPTAKRQLALLVEIAKHGDDVLDDRESAGRVRPWLLDFANAWGGLNDALVAKSRLPASLSDRGERADRVLARVFPEGVMFVRRDAHAAWAEGDRRVALIGELALQKEIDELVGAEHYDAAKATTLALGEALGVGRTRRETPKGSDMQSTVLRFSREVARYARLLAADVDAEEPASIERFRKAVAEPIDALRSRRVGGDDTAVDAAPSEPTTPSTHTSTSNGTPSPIPPSPTSNGIASPVTTTTLTGANADA
jgi:hypothetical protein